ncbi:MAG: lytic transglycosylase domain-containing protein [Alphaproteobacteria bacterium]|nr:lytic transglycosylase domain-containing protein [Alphaproteobacteria bacterium]
MKTIALAATAALVTGLSSAAAQTPSAEIYSNLSVLSASDAHFYREAISDERAGRFRDASTAFAHINDTALEGYVLAEKYLSPRGKRIPVQDLVAWLETYHELPIAERVYRLAVVRSVKKVRHHHHTRLVVIVTNIPVPGPPARHRSGGYEDADLPDPQPLSDAARNVLPAVEQSVRSDQPDSAWAAVQSISAIAPSLDVARLSHRVAASYLAEGMDDRASQIADAVSERDKRAVPLLYWDAGLADYRQGRFVEAAHAFESLSAAGSVPNWTRSAAAFWAARAYLQTGDATKVVPLLQLAAQSEPTFYGLIAERILGQDTQTGFSEPAPRSTEFSRLMENSAAHRAVALYQIGDREDAVVELNRAFGETDPALDATFAAIARKLDVPNLELRASESCASRGVMLTGLFPVPGYRPDGGYRIDPSLVLAFARVESRFQAEATSPAGAKGVMQLMPATAERLAGASAPQHLYDASYNLAIGQRYLEELLAKLNGNLFELAAAYNAGPGALTRWVGTKSAAMDDPLLFVESMPVAETRAYVKRMMTYHWMYRRRMGRDAKSLDETASGQWPNYRPASAPSVVPAQAPSTPAPQTTTPATTVVSDASPSS